MMKRSFTPQGWAEYLTWQTAGDRANLRRLNRLIDEVCRTPFAGTGKPEPLKGMLAGSWSRRITLEHRLVYEVHEDEILILRCRTHYEGM
jgi:toxin YoeB